MNCSVNAGDYVEAYICLRLHKKTTRGRVKYVSPGRFIMPDNDCELDVTAFYHNEYIRHLEPHEIVALRLGGHIK